MINTSFQLILFLIPFRKTKIMKFMKEKTLKKSVFFLFFFFFLYYFLCFFLYSAPKPLPKTFHIKGEKIYESDESFCSENQGARSPISPSKKSTSEKKASNNFFEEINAINPFEASKPQKILSESAQCVSLCESFKNVESSNRSSK